MRQGLRWEPKKKVNTSNTQSDIRSPYSHLFLAIQINVCYTPWPYLLHNDGIAIDLPAYNCHYNRQNDRHRLKCDEEKVVDDHIQFSCLIQLIRSTTTTKTTTSSSSTISTSTRNTLVFSPSLSLSLSHSSSSTCVLCIQCLILSRR